MGLLRTLSSDPVRAAPAASTPPPSAPTAPFLPGRLLDAPADYDRVFTVVRAAVRRALGIERPGLGLALSDLPPSLGAYWQVTGNYIVLNEGLVDAMRVHASSPLELNSFVFTILAHEYLHALGYLDEGEVRKVTAFVARATFGEGHPTTRMAEGDLWRMYPFLQMARGGHGRRFRIVRGFDRDTIQQYIR